MCCAYKAQQQIGNTFSLTDVFDVIGAKYILGYTPGKDLEGIHFH